MNVTKSDFSRVVRSSGISQETVEDMWNELEFFAGKLEKFIIKVWIPADHIFTEKPPTESPYLKTFLRAKTAKRWRCLTSDLAYASFILVASNVHKR